MTMIAFIRNCDGHQWAVVRYSPYFSPDEKILRQQLYKIDPEEERLKITWRRI